ncbi:MAG: hypothetical protein ACJAVR_000838 [Paracoccaceae bacterium]|jgi:hypothetical protein
MPIERRGRHAETFRHRLNRDPRIAHQRARRRQIVKRLRWGVPAACSDPRNRIADN